MNVEELLRRYQNGERDFSKVNLFKANLQKSTLCNAQLSYANLRQANLSEADLTGADLTGADLNQAKLTGAYLNQAKDIHENLICSDLSGADLTGADLNQAKLTGAYLNQAKLTGADLTGADLTGADLTGADLTGADLTGADLTGADLTGADLQNVLYEKDTQFPQGFDPQKLGIHRLTSAEKLTPPPLPSQEPITPPYSILLRDAAIVGSGSWLVVITLVSLVGTVWISAGFWIIILGIIICGSFIKKISSYYNIFFMFVIAIISSSVTFLFLPKKIHTGYKGILIVFLLTIFAGFLAFLLINLYHFFNKSN